MHELDLENALSSLELKTINAGEIVAGELVTFYSTNDIAVLVEGRRLFNIEIDDIDIDKEIVKWFSFTNEDFKTGRDIDIFNSVCKIFNYHGSLEAFLKEYGYEYLVKISTVQFFGTEEKATMPVVVFAPIEENTSKEKEPDQANNSKTLKEGDNK